VTTEETGLEGMVGHLQRALESEGRVRLAYLYGSALLRPDFRDVDVAVWAPETDGIPASLREAWLGPLGLRLEQSLRPRCPLDLRLLNRAPLLFQYAVVRRGRLLLARSELERVRFEATVASLALDLSVGLREYDRTMLAGIREWSTASGPSPT
jgi:predicted nucleotidyltransferase